MNPKTEKFLTAILGVGAGPVIGALQKDDALASWGPVRSIAAWLQYLGDSGKNVFTIPGSTEELELIKSQDGMWSGRIGGEYDHAFVDVPTAHVVALLSVVLDCTPTVTKSESSRGIFQIGKTIDLLVKNTSGGASGSASGTGVAAGRIQPTAPIPHTKTAPPAIKTKVKLPKKPKKVVAVAATPAADTAKSPTAATKSPTAATKSPASPAGAKGLALSEKEMEGKCSLCQKGQFTSGRFTGCYCFSSLAKSVKVTPVRQGVVLTFGPDWDTDAIETLSESFRRR